MKATGGAIRRVLGWRAAPCLNRDSLGMRCGSLTSFRNILYSCQFSSLAGSCNGNGSKAYSHVLFSSSASSHRFVPLLSSTCMASSLGRCFDVKRLGLFAFSASTRTMSSGRLPLTSLGVAHCSQPTPLSSDQVSFLPKRYAATPMPELESLKFGQFFTDHMLQVDWDQQTGWTAPVIEATKAIALHPSISALHYGLQVFEGLKCHRSQASPDRLILFRPHENARRLARSAERLALPSPPADVVVELIRQLVRVDERFVPKKLGFSLYVRPVLFSTQPGCCVSTPMSAKLVILLSPCGPYFPGGRQRLLFIIVPPKTFTNRKEERLASDPWAMQMPRRDIFQTPKIFSTKKQRSCNIPNTTSIFQVINPFVSWLVPCTDARSQVGSAT
eukprot:GHVT01045310.1.p1 GENE.GHVT01045310.1~~GHVT01045310.1.p1  ORF type:complete len:388 (-),score=-0.16 GHVT01045310.1:134-1297(-)